MKRMVAWAFYVVGGIVALKSVSTGLSQDSVLGWFFGVAYGVAIWWVAVGFGVRLGVTPDDFVASIKSVLGFGSEFERPQETTREVPRGH